MSSHRPLRLTLAHINDTHSQFDPTTLALTLPTLGQVHAPCGGYPRLSSALNQARADARQTGRQLLALHAGDCFQGSLYFSHYKGRLNAILNNQLDLDAMVLGNHEFDLGNPMLSTFIQGLQFPVLAANMDLSQERTDKTSPMRGLSNLLDYDPGQQRGRYLVKHLDGEPVALFGLTLDNMHELACADNDTQFHPCLDVARATIDAIEHAGINKIIILSHLGYDRDLQLAEQLDGVAAIIGGHTHVLQGDFQNLGLGGRDHYAVVINNTAVVQAGSNALFLGQLQLDLDADGTLRRVDGGNALLVGQTLSTDAEGRHPLPPAQTEQALAYLSQQTNVTLADNDPALQTLLQQHYKPALLEFEQQIIARTQQPLRHLRIPDDQGGSQVAPLLARAMRWQARQLGHQVDFGLHNAGGTRASVNQGPISAGWVAGTLAPFAIGIVKYQVSGDALRATLESAINNALNNGVVGTGTGSYPYVWGLRFRYDAEADMGQRIVQLQCRHQGHWVDVDAQRQYTGVSTGYTAAGKEGYYPLAHLPEPPLELQITIAEAVINHWRHLGQLEPAL
ncbi:bifunctional metallophosphatase/5'-nucleotidase [Ferrimonas kyonanensis]|uniref:bifunctional metallophosphatase/5'-nucleotidase n=1 Tax=Ferrimonas kyonanensis TaxID=364763 RepID=UPI000416A656|nr:bifunctional UDP-sugar hydrolase/5'-nucleotidase [Ferrimonas kyonanensis]